MTEIQKVRTIFDTDRFWEDLDRVRRERKLTWHQVTTATGVISIKSRGARRDNPRIDTLVPIAVWAGFSLDAYIQVYDQAGQQNQPKSQAPEPPLQLDRQREPGYDVIRFYADLDQVRVQRGLSWADVYRQVRSATLPIGLATFIRENIPLNPRVCAALATWARLDFHVYLFGASHQGGAIE